MATFVDQVNALATRMGQECKTLHTKIGDLSSLSTTTKASLVAALNEQVNALETLKNSVTGNTSDITTINSTISTLQTELNGLKDQIANSTNIDDTQATTTTTYSSSKIEDVVTAAKQAVKDDLLNGAGTAHDTLQELATLIEENEDAIAALEALAAGHVKYDDAQTLTDAQKEQARTNIGAASQAAVEAAQSQADKGVTDAAAAKSAADAAQADVDALSEAVGATDTDFTAAFEQALA